LRDEERQGCVTEQLVAKTNQTVASVALGDQLFADAVLTFFVSQSVVLADPVLPVFMTALVGLSSGDSERNRQIQM
jgi:hypothetical protein